MYEYNWSVEIIFRFPITGNIQFWSQMSKAKAAPPPGCTLNINDPQIQEAAIRIQASFRGHRYLRECLVFDISDFQVYFACKIS